MMSTRQAKQMECVTWVESRKNVVFGRNYNGLLPTGVQRVSGGGRRGKWLARSTEARS